MTDEQPDLGPVALTTEHIAELTEHMNRLAAAAVPLLSDTHQKTQHRVRQLEQRLHLRQERPTVMKMASLLTSVQRMGNREELGTHVEEGLLNILFGLGYEQFADVGDPFDSAEHEVLEAQEGAQDPVVAQVHAKGLRAFDDVIIRARVTVGSGQAVGQQQENGTST